MDGGYLDDLNLASRRRATLNDEDIEENQNHLVEFLSQELGERKAVISKRFDWAFPYAPDFLDASGQKSGISLPRATLLTRGVL